MTDFVQLAWMKALTSKLEADATLMAIVQKVYDHVPEGVAMPYLSLGDMQMEEDSTMTERVYRGRVVLHIFSKERGREEVLNIMERLNNLLHEGSLTLSGYALVMMRFTRSEVEVMRDGKTYHGRMQFAALIEEA